MTGLRQYPELDGKTFLICIGAAKCATSWLYHYLSSLPEVAVSPLKEVHFFDARFPQHALGDMQALALSRLSHHLRQDGSATAHLHQRPAFRASIDRAQMIYDENAYFAHFARLCGPDTRVFCDITPSYSAIGRAGFEDMRSFCSSQRCRVKILFIMRDPVTRYWSQLRHLQQMNPANDAETRWRDALRSPAVNARADYRQIVTDLDALFPVEDLIYLFYETLFEPDALKRLCSFAGVPWAAANDTRARNETTIKTPLPDEAEAAIRAHLAPQYAFCRSRFGEGVPATWNAASFPHG